MRYEVWGLRFEGLVLRGKVLRCQESGLPICDFNVALSYTLLVRGKTLNPWLRPMPKFSLWLTVIQNWLLSRRSLTSRRYQKFKSTKIQTIILRPRSGSNNSQPKADQPLAEILNTQHSKLNICDQREHFPSENELIRNIIFNYAQNLDCLFFSTIYHWNAVNNPIDVSGFCAYGLYTWSGAWACCCWLFLFGRHTNQWARSPRLGSIP